MGKTKSSKFEDNRAFTCSVPAEVIPVDPEYPNTIFVVRNYGSEEYASNYNHIKCKEQMICQISSKYPMFVATETDSTYNADKYVFYIAPKKVQSGTSWAYSYEDVVKIKQSVVAHIDFKSLRSGREDTVILDGSFSYEGQPVARVGSSPSNLQPSWIDVGVDSAGTHWQYIGKDGVPSWSQTVSGNTEYVEYRFQEKYGSVYSPSTSIYTSVYFKNLDSMPASISVGALIKNHTEQTGGSSRYTKKSFLTNCISSQTRSFSTLSDWQSYVETEIWGN